MRETNDRESIKYAELIVACFILLAEIGLIVFQALGQGGHFLLYLLPIIAFFIWFKFICQAFAPDWLLDISCTLQLLVCGYASFGLCGYMSTYDTAFGPLMLGGMGIAGGLVVCCLCLYSSYKCKSSIGHVISALMCFAFVVAMVYWGVRAHWSTWSQIPLLLLITIGLFHATYVPGCKATFVIIAQLILSFVALPYAAFLDSGPYVGECITITFVVAPSCGGFLAISCPTQDISDKDPNRTVKVLGAGLLSLICIVMTLAPFAVMFL